MNDKLAKSLRHAAKYRNQSATPGVIPFPGVARMYSHPVYTTRQTKKSSYVKLPMMEGVTKVFTTLRRLALDGRGKPILEMADKPDPKTGVIMPKTELVAVPKPARLDSQCPKGLYRALKKFAKQNMLLGLGTAIHVAYQKEVTA